MDNSELKGHWHMVNEKPQEGPKKLLLSETAILAVLSAIAYLFAFLYERGYTSYFGIPVQFTNVSLNTLLIFGASTFTFLYISIYLIDVAFPLTQSKHPYLAFHIPRLLLLLFLYVLVPLFLFQGYYWKLIIITFSSWCLLVLINVVGLLIKYRKKGSRAERYNIAMEAEAKQYTPGLFDLITRRYGIRNTGLLIWLLFIASWLATALGQSEAVTQTHFLVLNTTPQMVVLRVSGENLI